MTSLASTTPTPPQATSSSSSSSPGQNLTASTLISRYRIDPDAPVFVAKAIVASVAAGAAAGGTLGVIRTVNPFAFSIGMGVNGGAFALTFFGLREYLVSPLLISSATTSSHARRLAEFVQREHDSAPSTSHNPTPTLSHVRTDRLLDSALAGLLTGSILSGATRAKRTIIPAGITSALVATILQYAVNEVKVVRLRFLARRGGDLSVPSTSTEESSVPAPDAYTSFTQPRSAAYTGPDSLPSRIMEAMGHLMPIKKLSDEEYLEGLVKRQKEVNERLADIEVEEVRLYEAMNGDGNGGDVGVGAGAGADVTTR